MVGRKNGFVIIRGFASSWDFNLAVSTTPTWENWTVWFWDSVLHILQPIHFLVPCLRQTQHCCLSASVTPIEADVKSIIVPSFPAPFVCLWFLAEVALSECRKVTESDGMCPVFFFLSLPPLSLSLKRRVKVDKDEEVDQSGKRWSSKRRKTLNLNLQVKGCGLDSLESPFLLWVLFVWMFVKELQYRPASSL